MKTQHFTPASPQIFVRESHKLLYNSSRAGLLT